jgi:uncharacterized protein
MSVKMNEYSEDLKKIIYQNKLLMDILKKIHEIEPTAYLCAGVIRNTIWAYLHDQTFALKQTEIDVIFYDAEDVNAVHEKRIEQQLIALYPEIEWDITNQAFVHEWYKPDDGSVMSQLKSIDEALSLWPETATAIAVRLNAEQEIEYIAPFGLIDLFELKLRWNKALVSHEGFMKRLEQKQFLKKWSKLKLIQ